MIGEGERIPKEWVKGKDGPEPEAVVMERIGKEDVAVMVTAVNAWEVKIPPRILRESPRTRQFAQRSSNGTLLIERDSPRHALN